MAPSHAATGALAGVAAAAAAAAAFGWPAGVADLAAAAGIGAGAALLPDLDHPRSTASRSLGPVTGLLSRAARSASAAVYRSTRTPRDAPGDGRHRYLLHTPVFAIAAGAVAGAASTLWLPALAAVVWFALALALRGLGRALPKGPTRRGLTAGPTAFLFAGLATVLLVWGGVSTGPHVGAALALGMVVHDLGDALTRSAVPLAWPVKVRGRRWAAVGAPRGMRFATGDRAEHVIRWACLLAAPALGAAHLAS
ncbi:metal-dependent hydrolase [Nocardiopsis chromatogenes]|uniref:metal-dependent hydrolase n=1 Tax=Nocardiopsis chromatogenes TaxID=280239 RepID=UPI0003484EDA|nr:metal-dependent hydrolase [Nocardiopsis chromatogenes]